MLRRMLVASLSVAAFGLSAAAQEAPVVPVNASGHPAGVPMAMPSTGYGGPVGETTLAPHEVMDQRHGLLPFLRKGVFWKKNFGGCESCEPEGLLKRGFGHGGLGHGGLGHGGLGHGGGAGGFPGMGVPGVPQPGQPGMGMPGTLVFPYNPYIRSPRDYFMYEPK